MNEKEDEDETTAQIGLVLVLFELLFILLSYEPAHPRKCFTHHEVCRVHSTMQWQGT